MLAERDPAAPGDEILCTMCDESLAADRRLQRDDATYELPLRFTRAAHDRSA
jgi:hypothetical protein